MSKIGTKAPPRIFAVSSALKPAFSMSFARLPYLAWSWITPGTVCPALRGELAVGDVFGQIERSTDGINWTEEVTTLSAVHGIG